MAFFRVYHLSTNDSVAIEWRNARLADNQTDEPFTFQVVFENKYFWRVVFTYETFIFVRFQAVLHRSGDIVFAYESVPSNLAELIGGSEAGGAVAVGISDAFELGGNLYGYHKAEVKLGK